MCAWLWIMLNINNAMLILILHQRCDSCGGPETEDPRKAFFLLKIPHFGKHCRSHTPGGKSQVIESPQLLKEVLLLWWGNSSPRESRNTRTVKWCEKLFVFSPNILCYMCGEMNPCNMIKIYFLIQASISPRFLCVEVVVYFIHYVITI